VAIEGDSGVIAVPAQVGPLELKNLLQGLYLGMKVRAITFYAPDGTDPPGTGTLAANSATLFVGPNGAAGFPLAPGAVLTLEDVDVSRCAIANPTKAAGQNVFFAYGGTPGP
jgi:hypothetical protein